MALVLLIRINNNIANEIEKCISEIKIIEPDLYFYPKQDFHITVMDILKGEANRSLPDNINKYRECVFACAKEISPFKIDFHGLTASDNAIMVRGYYEYALQKFREELRMKLKHNGLKLEERYETISSHITIARIADILH